MSVTLTESAARHVNEMLRKRGSGVGLRISTRKSGCSGYAYQVDYVDEPAEGDLVYESQGIKVIINEKDLAHLDGLQIDYVKQNMLNEGLEFNNPNVKEMCGCGESVSF